jgi:hypothetical protein
MGTPGEDLRAARSLVSGGYTEYLGQATRWVEAHAGAE